jgi:hypothetical protein
MHKNTTFSYRCSEKEMITKKNKSPKTEEYLILKVKLKEDQLSK